MYRGGEGVTDLGLSPKKTFFYAYPHSHSHNRYVIILHQEREELGASFFSLGGADISPIFVSAPCQSFTFQHSNSTFHLDLLFISAVASVCRNRQRFSFPYRRQNSNILGIKTFFLLKSKIALFFRSLFSFSFLLKTRTNCNIQKHFSKRE